MTSLGDIVKQVVNTLRADGVVVTKAVAHVVAETVYNPDTGKFFAEGALDEHSASIVIRKTVESLRNSEEITFMALMMQISNLL